MYINEIGGLKKWVVGDEKKPAMAGGKHSVDGTPANAWRGKCRNWWAVLSPAPLAALICATETGIKNGRARRQPEDALRGRRSTGRATASNDGKCDSHDGSGVGSLAIDTTPGKGALWRIGADGSARANGRRLPHLERPGLEATDDRHMYFTDSGKRVIWVYDFNENGSRYHRQSPPLCPGPPGRRQRS